MTPCFTRRLERLASSFEGLLSLGLSTKQRIDPRDLERQFREFLRRSEPSLMRLLYDTWNSQRDTIKYQDLALGVTSGRVSPSTLQRWSEQYSAFVNQRLAPAWRVAAQNGYNTGNFQLTSGGTPVPPVEWDLFRRRLDNWVETRGGELIVNLTTEQQTAVSNLLRWHISNDPLSPSELAIRIRSVVGLTPREEQAVRNRFQSLLATDGISRVEALELASSYAGYLHRVRATRIARTELAFGYNRAQLDVMRESVALGDIGADTVKVWYTAEDERVCPICGALDGDEVLLEEEFSATLGKRAVAKGYTSLTPPIHPSCRCTLLYEPTEGLGREEEEEEEVDPDVADPDGAGAYVEEVYGSYDSDFWSGGQQKGEPLSTWPTGAFNETSFINAAEKIPTASRSPQRQALLRREVHNLLAEYKIPVADVLNQSDPFKVDFGSGGVSGTEANSLKVRRIRGAYGTHFTRSGEIRISTDTANRIKRLKTVGPSDPEGLRGLRTLVHESLHGSGLYNRGLGSAFYSGYGVQLEELTTELSARWILSDKFGDTDFLRTSKGGTNPLGGARGGYPGYVRGLVSLLAGLDTDRGVTRTKEERLRILARGALNFKRSRPVLDKLTTVRNEARLDQLRGFASSVADAIGFDNDADRRAFVRGFEADFTSRAVSWRTHDAGD